MKRLLFIIGLISFSPFASSNNMTSVAELLVRGKDPNNLRDASTALVRCAALIDLSQVLASSNIESTVYKDPTNLLQGAVNIRLNIDNLSEGAPQAVEVRKEYIKSTVNEVKVYFGEYQKWFSKATKASDNGDYFDDQLLCGEFILCNEVYDAFIEGAQS
jgi:hypothetical protein